MDKWKIRQSVDLAYSGNRPNVWPEALLVSGDRWAHTWEIEVRNAGTPADLSDATVVAYFNRCDNVSVAIKGSTSGNMASVTLEQACYAIQGPLVGIFRLTTTDGTTLTVSVLRFMVAGGPCNAVVDPGEVVPNLDELLAQIAAMEAATAAANLAAQKQPIIGHNSNWWVWDSATGKYVDTGKPSQGSGDGTGDGNGADGFSPIATITKVGDVATITITDAHGTTTASVKDGAQGAPGEKGETGAKGDKGEKGDPGATGADGYTPMKGTDYWTDADRKQMVQDVLASLPNGDEVSY